MYAIGIKAKGSCSTPFASTLEPISLKARTQTFPIIKKLRAGKKNFCFFIIWML